MIDQKFVIDHWINDRSFFKLEPICISDNLYLPNVLLERKIFKRPKNREDGSDFHDFRTKSIAATQAFFAKFFERASERRNETSSEKTSKNFAKTSSAVVIMLTISQFDGSGTIDLAELKQMCTLLGGVMTDQQVEEAMTSLSCPPVRQRARTHARKHSHTHTHTQKV